MQKMLDFQKEFQPLSEQNAKFETLAIVVPCYNHARFLKKTFESIAHQTRLPDEVIFINDHSKDNTREIIDELVETYQASNLGKIKFIRENNSKNLGQAMTLNKAINLANSDLVMILNDDDYLMHDAVEMMFRLFREHQELALIGGLNIDFSSDDFLDHCKKNGAEHIIPEKEELKITTPEDALELEDFCSLNMTHTGSTFVRNKAISIGLYRELKKRIVRFSDRDFQIRMNLLYPVGSSKSIPFCFWRSNSSVDSGVNS